MYLILKRVDCSGNYTVAYTFTELQRAREQYQNLLVTYAPSQLKFVQSNAFSMNLTIHEDGRPDFSPLSLPVASATSPGIIQLATAIQASYDNPEDYVDGIPVSVPPSLIKEMIDSGMMHTVVPDATGETAGKVRLANEAERSYGTASNGDDNIAVMQPVGTKSMIDTAANYTTVYTPSVSNIKEALNDLYAQINYLPLTIESYTTPKTLYEVGQAPDVTFMWSYNKDVTVQSFNRTQLDKNIRTATIPGLDSTRAVVLTASDGKTPVSRTLNISFTWRIYWGTTVAPETLSTEFILSLDNSRLATGGTGVFDFNSPEGRYSYIAAPAAFNMHDYTYIEGWRTELVTVGTLQFTNLHDRTTEYVLMRTTRPGLGRFAMEFK